MLTTKRILIDCKKKIFVWIESKCEQNDSINTNILLDFDNKKKERKLNDAKWKLHNESSNFFDSFYHE